MLQLICAFLLAFVTCEIATLSYENLDNFSNISFDVLIQKTFRYDVFCAFILPNAADC